MKGLTVIYRITQGLRKGSRAFTFIELMMAMAIVLIAITASISSYVTLWTWWHETNPEIEAQRIARVALATVVDGVKDTTAGTYVINGTTYTRRNGIMYATQTPTLPSDQAINFCLAPDTSNVRSFYLGTDSETGQNVVYYRNNAGVVKKIDATLGISDLIFSNVVNGTATENMVNVTAVVDWDVEGVGQTPYRVYISYSRLVNLKNVIPIS